MTQYSIRRKWLITTALSPLISSAFTQGCNHSPIKLKIGATFPLTGSLAAIGNDLLNGIVLATEEINKEGFAFNNQIAFLEVVAKDDKGSIDAGIIAAQQLVSEDVIAVIGNYNSGISIATAPIYAEAGLPQLSISTNPQFTKLGLKTTFRLLANDALQAKAISSFCTTKFPAKKRYGIFDDGTKYGKDLAETVSAQLKPNGINVVLRQTFDDKTTSFSDLARNIKDQAIDVIVSTLSDFQILPLLHELQNNDYTNIVVIGGDSIKTTHMLAGAERIQGLYATSPVIETNEFTGGNAFLSKYRKRFHMDPAYAAHYTYDAVYVLTSAIRRCASAAPKRVIEELRRIDGYAPVTGSMKWDTNGEQRYGMVGIYEAHPKFWELLERSDVW
jgi:branched-chain amino acid transport system substrate-binding protein